MGNHRFRLSDIIPNAWLIKLRDMGRTRSQKTSHSTKKQPPPTSSSAANPHQTPKTKQRHPSGSHQRKSYYFTRGLTAAPNADTNIFHSISPRNPKAPDTHFPNPPPKSSNMQLHTTRRNRAPVTPSVSPSSGYRATMDSTDIIHGNVLINADSRSFNIQSDEPSMIPGAEFPPLAMKKRPKPNRAVKEQRSIPFQRRPVNSKGMRLQTTSPRLSTRKIQSHGRRSVSSTPRSSSWESLSETLAVVKSSSDPQRDFRESMVEMIEENNIRASKDLEKLLTCYLSLNSNEHHDLIIRAFKQIWFDLNGS